MSSENSNPLIPDIIEEKIRAYRNPSDLHKERTGKRSVSQKAADLSSSFFGSWKFIILYILFTVIWCGLNVIVLIPHWDNYPFQAYTFAVSVLAILMSGLILLSGNRQAEIDRAHAENAYHHVDEVNEKQDKQIKILQGQNKVLEDQNNIMIEQHKELLERFNSLAEK